MIANNDRISVARLREVVMYDPKTGDFTWLARGIKRFDNRFAGKRASTLTPQKYNQLCIDHKVIRAARAAYAMMMGNWPETVVDHINGVRNDDRWSNLRLATSSDNACNSAKQSNNKTGFKGVTRRRKGKPFEATIMRHGKHTYLGTYDTAEEAYSAYCKAAEALHGEYGRMD